ncbi:hypothetical protein A176_002923 [Myxococcus hansupus]|uniref:Lipoprotein n=1 Tax=Pseudomyxococcus hansupus TaxID=1297742 RepID=A0A0H4WRA6_9BACT|nr:hypothetical protein [Myxococcus hansupus]AKQ66011.1 hypothetical protein A176_002923 [Myxococcus hansupus]
MRAFRPAVVLLSLLLASCAAPQVRPPGALRKVVVVVGSRVDSLPSFTYRQDMMGEGNPRSVLVSQAQATLQERGFEVVGTRISAAPAPSINEVVEMIRDNDAEAGVVVVLNWVDVTSAQMMGRTEVLMETGVVGPNGRLRWSNPTRTTSMIGVYQAQTDLRSYLRKAVVEAIQAIP